MNASYCIKKGLAISICLLFLWQQVAVYAQDAAVSRAQISGYLQRNTKDTLKNTVGFEKQWARERTAPQPTNNNGYSGTMEPREQAPYTKPQKEAAPSTTRFDDLPQETVDRYVQRIHYGKILSVFFFISNIVLALFINDIFMTPYAHQLLHHHAGALSIFEKFFLWFNNHGTDMYFTFFFTSILFILATFHVSRKDAPEKKRQNLKKTAISAFWIFSPLCLLFYAWTYGRYFEGVEVVNFAKEAVSFRGRTGDPLDVYWANWGFAAAFVWVNIYILPILLKFRHDIGQFFTDSLRMLFGSDPEEKTARKTQTASAAAQTKKETAARVEKQPQQPERPITQPQQPKRTDTAAFTAYKKNLITKQLKRLNRTKSLLYDCSSGIPEKLTNRDTFTLCDIPENIPTTTSADLHFLIMDMIGNSSMVHHQKNYDDAMDSLEKSEPLMKTLKNALAQPFMTVTWEARNDRIFIIIIAGTADAGTSFAFGKTQTNATISGTECAFFKAA